MHFLAVSELLSDSLTAIYIELHYSIVKDSSADLGVNFKIVQNRPTVKAVCTKISNFFLHICQFFCTSERK